MPDINIKITAQEQITPALTGVNRQLSRLGNAFRNLAAAAGGPFAAIGRGVSAIGSKVMAAQAKVMAFGQVLAGLAMGAMALIAGGAFLAVGAINAMRDSAERAAGATDGLGGSLAAAGEEAATSGSELTNAADEAEKATTKIEGVFGAFGDVGAGFIQRAGSVTTSVADKMQKAASGASDLAKEVADATGSANGSLSTFGKTLDRLGEAWQRVKDIFWNTSAKAMLPLLEALAAAMEDPRFIEFVTLLAEDLANALSIVVGWIVEKAIPAFLDWADEVNKVGGPVKWLMLRFGELRDTFLKIIGIILGALLFAMGTWDATWRAYYAIVADVWEQIQTGFSDAFDALILAAGSLGTAIGDAIKAGFSGVVGFVEGVLFAVQSAFTSGVNGIIRNINSLIDTYNKIAGPLGLPTVGQVGLLAPPTQPNPPGGPRPSGAVAASAGGITLNVYVSGFSDPASAGKKIGTETIRQLQAAGVRL